MSTKNDNFETHTGFDKIGLALFLSVSSGGYSNLGARGKNFQKLMLSEKKRGLIWACIFFSQNQGVL